MTAPLQLLETKDYESVRTRLAALQYPVRLLFFSQKEDCEYCRIMRDFLHPLLDLADGKIDVEFYDVVDDPELASEYNIVVVPSLIVRGEEDYGIRFTGVPGGYELISLLHALELVGTKNHGLTPETLQKLSQIRKPLHIKIFVTPSCPYCPATVSLAHKLAFVNRYISAEMIEATEFSSLAEKHSVRGVPHICINDSYSFEGNLPEALFVEQILQAYNSQYNIT